MNGGLVSNMSKSLLIVTIVLSLKTTSNKMHFITLNRAIRAGLDLIDPLAHDQNSRTRAGDKIPSVDTLKRRNILDHSKLPVRISNNIAISGRLRKGDSRA
jgi:hypothetical protein